MTEHNNEQERQPAFVEEQVTKNMHLSHLMLKKYSCAYFWEKP